MRGAVGVYDIGICDDGEFTCSEIEEMLLQYEKKHMIKFAVHIWNSGEQLCRYLKNSGGLDLIFLDIELLDLDGIVVGRYIREELEIRDIQIVYISCKGQYAQQLFKMQPMDFLVKPILQKQIDETMELAIKIIDKNNMFFEFQKGGEYYKIPYGDILYFYSAGRKIHIVLKNKEIEFYDKIDTIREKLPEDFILIHKSYIINRNHVRKYTYETAEMSNDKILSISKPNRKDVREHILNQG